MELTWVKHKGVWLETSVWDTDSHSFWDDLEGTGAERAANLGCDQLGPYTQNARQILPFSRCAWMTWMTKVGKNCYDTSGNETGTGALSPTAQDIECHGKEFGISWRSEENYWRTLTDTRLALSQGHDVLDLRKIQIQIISSTHSQS